ncbi:MULTISPECIES: hypothetical protein [unclassified Methylobacterium]|jgi:hypothetical protein|uniref:hypothetical protein n=1 Tax=unclassified Methylobacterium TaxID=2615210 RepID=UPI001352FECE|nr:hypothetical protein [Methylobacterium sp. 2A]MWV22682.1 hypothetical protein [Methylobacterium sp. 2A]
MARTKHYPSDATIADILPDLADGEAYLRQVLVTMRMCQKHYGDAWVRIGVTGRSPTPSYRIDRPDETATGDGAFEAGRALFGAYGGRSHDRFTQVNTAETRWSTRALGMAEMLTLHESLRRPRGDAA